MFSIPPVTRALVIINVVVFLAQQALGSALDIFALWPIGDFSFAGGGSAFQPWQIVTYSFLHGGVAHILFNMFALYMFGGELEQLFGPKRFLNLYLASVITAAIAQLIVSALMGSPYPTEGASGGVFGLLLAYAIYFPNRTLLLIFPPIPLPARVFVILYGALELYLGVTGSQAGVAHFAHLGGMLGAWLLLSYWRGKPPFGRR